MEMNSSYNRQRGNLDGSSYTDGINVFGNTVWFNTKYQSIIDELKSRADDWPDFIRGASSYRFLLVIDCNLNYHLRPKDDIAKGIAKNKAAAVLGSIKTPKKARSSRENGKKGGRPRQK